MPQNSYSQIIARLLGFGDPAYRLSHVYIEFENVGFPGDPVTPPDVAREAGLEYYQGLTGSRDFLRVPILGDPSVSLSDGVEGVDYDTLTFYAQSEGTTGMHGLPFSADSNSTVYARAIVATPVPADWSRDLVYSRINLDVDQQLLKPASGQISVPIKLRFPNE